MLFFNLAPIVEKRTDAFRESCIDRMANGDSGALGELYEDTKSAVFGLALSITHNAEDAEDVMQDTFLSIYASARNYKKMGKPMAWVLTIAKNFALMKVRNRQKAADLSEEDWNLLQSDEDPGKVEQKLTLTAALKKLTPEESQIVMLHSVAGWKHRETAEMLGLPLSTVLSKYNRAMKKLKSVLKEGGFDEKQGY